MINKATKEFWIFEPALIPTLLILAHIVNYDFDDNDLNAIKYGLTGTSNEKDIRWTYQFNGSQTIDLRFTLDEDNGDIIFIQLIFDKALSAQIDLAIFVVQDFYIQHKYFQNGMTTNL